MQRCLRSKAKRNALWIAAGGKCQICGADLLPSWHADHINPFKVTGETNVHEMQATCPVCNLRKGSLMLRSHQLRAQDIITRIVAGVTTLPEFVCAYVCPGGGKSFLPPLFAHWCISKSDLAEKVCWVVPNGALRDQAVDAFRKDGLAAKILGHDLEIVSSTNSLNPTKGLAGYVTTYHALLRDSAGINTDEFKRFRYLLVLDEFHHCELNGPFHRAVAPLVERAALVLLMTGTIDRGNKKPVYPLPYGADRKVLRINDSDFQWIEYGVEQATSEKSILRVLFKLFDAKSKWYDETGCIQESDQLGENKSALFTALRTEFATELLDDCCRDWMEYKKTHPRSKLLVVCADIAQAREMLVRVRRHGINTDIATYKDDDPDSTIESYRISDSPECLVTVAKAYEGLDVPRITHIACLTHIRSRPWIEQMIARAWRFDPSAGPWESQFAYVYAPDDDGFKLCVKAIEEAQPEPVSTIKEAMHGADNPGGRDDPPSEPAAEITPITSKATDLRASELYGDSLSAEETEFYRSITEKIGVHLSPIQAKALFEETQKRLSDGWVPDKKDTALKDPNADERIELLSTQLNNLVRFLARGEGNECTRLNYDLKRLYGPRESMGEEKLRDAISHLRRVYANRLPGRGEK